MKFFFCILLLLYLFILLSDNLQKTKADNDKIYYTQQINSKKAANILSKVDDFRITLIDKLSKDYPNEYKINRLKKQFDIKEIPYMYKKYTAYTINKKHIYICLRKTDYEFETNMNGLYFIVMHEMAHIMSITIGHTKEFWHNYKLILKTAIRHKLYNFRNYYNNPITHCNKQINSTPYLT